MKDEAEVFDSVVIEYAVDVVHVLFWQEPASKMLLHDPPVLPDLSCFVAIPYSALDVALRILPPMIFAAQNVVLAVVVPRTATGTVAGVRPVWPERSAALFTHIIG